MTRRFRAAVLAAAVILTPAAASAAMRIEAAPRASTPAADASPLSAPFPNMIHWAMVAVTATFVGVALYIHRRRGFEID